MAPEQVRSVNSGATVECSPSPLAWERGDTLTPTMNSYDTLTQRSNSNGTLAQTTNSDDTLTQTRNRNDASNQTKQALGVVIESALFRDSVLAVGVQFFPAGGRGRQRSNHMTRN